MKVGITATHKGLRPAQKEVIRTVLQHLYDQGAREFRHGDCIGADDQAATIAHEIGYRLVAHPGINPRHPEDTSTRAFHPSDEVRPAKLFLVRDRDIVDETDILVAGPAQKEEVIRSGTWTTYRYAKKKNRPTIVVYPDGVCDCRAIHAKFEGWNSYCEFLMATGYGKRTG